MFKRFSFRHLKFACLILLSFACLGALFNLWLENLIYAAILSLTVTLNISLVWLLVTVLVRKHPSVLDRADDTDLEQTVLSQVNSQTGALFKQNETQFPGSTDQDLFTLGTLSFEPPEPIRPDPNAIRAKTVSTAPVVKKRKPQRSSGVSVESALTKRPQNAVKSKNTQLQERCHNICRILKQANQEVAIWTEGELAVLSNALNNDTAEDKDIVALLLPRSIVRINTHRTFEYEHHAQLFNNILFATGQDLGVFFVNSSKDEVSGQCVVSFEHLGKPITWRFLEPGEKLSEKFVKNAFHWVGKRSNGRFLSLNSNGRQKEFVFVINDVLRELKAESSLV